MYIRQVKDGFFGFKALGIMRRIGQVGITRSGCVDSGIALTAFFRFRITGVRIHTLFSYAA
jgi:hypothetical protein